MNDPSTNNGLLRSARILALAASPFVLLYIILAPIAPDWTLRQAFPVDHDHAWAGGAAGVFYTSDAGLHWQRVVARLSSRTNPFWDSRGIGHIFYATRDRALVRTADGIGVVNSSSGLIEVRSRNPEAWSNIGQTVFVDELHGWAGGSDKLAPDGSGNAVRLVDEAKEAQAAGKTQVGCEDSFVSKTEDGGKTWRVLTTLNCLHQIVAVSPDVVWLATWHHLLWTKDGGRSWSNRPVNSPEILFADQEHAVLDRAATTSEPTDLFTSVRFPLTSSVTLSSVLEVWGITYTGDKDNGVVQHSCDGGKTWITVEKLIVSSNSPVYSRVPGEALVFRGGIAYFITDHGRTWHSSLIAAPPLWIRYRERLGRMLFGSSVAPKNTTLDVPPGR